MEKNNLRILHLPAFYFPSVGGGDLYMKELSERLVRRGHEIHVYTSDIANFMTLEKVKERLSTINSVAIQRFTTLTSTQRPIKNLPFIIWRAIQLFDCRYSYFDRISLFLRMFTFPFMPNMLIYILRKDWDLIHAAEIPFSNMALAYVASKRKKVPLVYTPFYHTISLEHRCFSFFKMLKEAAAIFACTEYEKECLVERGMLEDNIHVTGMGMNPNEFKNGNGLKFREKYSIEEHTPLILFVGRLTYGKGLFHLILAMNYICEKFPGAKLVIAGPSSSEYAKFYFSLPQKLRDKIINVGIITGREKADMFYSADIFAMPSHIDAFGIAYLEAWFCKKPVIGANYGASPYVIADGVDGFLVTFGNTSEIAKKVCLLLENEELRHKFGTSGYKKVIKNYTWDIIADKIENVYGQILGK